MEANPFPFTGAERPRLVPDRVGDAEPAEIVHETGTPQRANLRIRQSELGAGGRRQVSDRSGMPKRVRRLEVDEVRDRRERVVKTITGQHHRQSGLGVDHRVPGRDRVEARQDRLRLARHQLGERRVELLAATPLRELPCRLHAADPERDLRELGQLGDTRRQRDLLALQLAWPAVPVPLLVGAAERLEHIVGQPELLAQRPCDRGVVGDHAVHIAVAGQRELEPDPKATQRRMPRPDPANSRDGAAARCGTRSRTSRTSARCHRRTTSPARARRSDIRR